MTSVVQRPSPGMILQNRVSQRRPHIAHLARLNAVTDDRHADHCDSAGVGSDDEPGTDGDPAVSTAPAAGAAAVMAAMPAAPLLAPPLGLSVVIPAYNEAQRLPGMLDEAIAFLEARATEGMRECPQRDGAAVSERPSDAASVPPHLQYELIVVDDGSTDETVHVAMGVAREHMQWLSPLSSTSPSPMRAWAGPMRAGTVRVISLAANLGKGGAVRCGVLAARGASILFADADGATRFSDIAILERALLATTATPTTPTASPAATTATTPPPSHRRKDPSPDHPPLEPLGIAVGSRAFLQDSEVKRSLIRSIMMYLFHAFVRFIGIRTLQDTQCGFKLFTRAAAQRVFPHLHSQRWVFDIELLLLAQWAAIPVAEVAVAWHEVPGTKLRLMNDTLRMAIDLLLIRFNYLAGIWKTTDLICSGVCVQEQATLVLTDKDALATPSASPVVPCWVCEPLLPLPALPLPALPS